jgi:hypothetical protein
MDIGMLWFDDSPRTMDEKIQRAVDFYTEKYGRRPTICMVHPSTTQADSIVGGVQVRLARSVMPHHFLVGIEDEKSNGKDAAAKQLALELGEETHEAARERPKRRPKTVPALDSQAA